MANPVQKIIILLKEDHAPISQHPFILSRLKPLMASRLQGCVYIWSNNASVSVYKCVNWLGYGIIETRCRYEMKLHHREEKIDFMTLYLIKMHFRIWRMWILPNGFIIYPCRRTYYVLHFVVCLFAKRGMWKYCQDNHFHVFHHWHL